MTTFYGPKMFAQDSVPVPDTPVAVVEDASTIEKIDQVVDQLGHITGVDTLETIGEALTAVQDKIAEAKAAGERAWYEWVLYVLGVLPVLFGLYWLVKGLFTGKPNPAAPPRKQ